MAKKKSKKAGLKVDFTGVEARTLLDEGEYLVTVAEIEQKESESGNDYLSWTFEVTEEGYSGKLYHNTSLQPQSLWSLRNLLETLQVEVPDGPMEIDFDELVGLEVIAVVEHEKYEGKMRARITDFLKAVDAEEEDAEEDDDEEEEEEAPPPKKGKKGKKAPGPEEDEEEDVEVEGDEEEELEKLTEEQVGDMDEEELADLVKTYGLEVNLKKLKTTRKKIGAVIDALEEAGYLEEE